MKSFFKNQVSKRMVVFILLGMFLFMLSLAACKTSGPVNQSMKPQITVPVDLEVEKNVQNSVDAGHSPWKLDPIFVAQVFVSLKISPQGINGEYPIKIEDLSLIKNTDKEAIVKVSGNKTPIRKVYLKRLIRQDSTGIWTVVGYDPSKNIK